MRIELDKLEGNASSFSYRYGPSELTLEEENARLSGPASVEGRLKRSDHEVRLRGRIEAEAEVDCDRCLTAINVPVRAEFDVTYVPATDYSESETAELQEEDLNLSVYDEEAIDVDELVREQILLALPTRALCSEECRGLCPACGANRNAQPCDCETSETDPRWDALKGLVNHKS